MRRSADQLIIAEQRKQRHEYQLGIVGERRGAWRVEAVQEAVEHVEAVVAHVGPDDWMSGGGVRCQRRRTVVQLLLLRPTTTTGRHLSSIHSQHAPASPMHFDLSAGAR